MSDGPTWADENIPDQEAAQKLDLRPHLTALQGVGKELIRELERARRDGAFGYELEDKIEDWTQKASGAYWHVGRFDGAKGFLMDVGKAVEDENLLADFEHRIDGLAQGVKDDKLFSDFAARLREEGVGAAEARQAGQALRTAVGSAASVNYIPTVQEYTTMPPEERMRLSPAQIDAMTARLLAKGKRR
jgi:hypothetical protein